MTSGLGIGTDQIQNREVQHVWSFAPLFFFARAEKNLIVGSIASTESLAPAINQTETELHQTASGLPKPFRRFGRFAQSLNG
jgi:hypothetical protein